MYDKINLLMRIYLDVCCLNRPFDDQVQDRVRLESEAVLSVLNHSKAKGWRLLNSEVIGIEISKMPENDKRQKVTILSTMLQSYISVDEDIESRAVELENLTFKPFDALHIACAEKGKADVLLTTDDAFLRKASQCKETLNVRVENPLRWLMEVIEK
ncbi:MAG: PIN domain-containing protein [Nitrospirota bacterium]